jgi:hypothetical protein
MTTITAMVQKIAVDVTREGKDEIKVSTGVARRLLMTVAVIALAPAAFAQSNAANGTPNFLCAQ